MLESRNYFGTCNVLKGRNHETWLKGIRKVVEIRIKDLILRRGKGPKKEIGSLCRTKMKEIMIFFT